MSLSDKVASLERENAELRNGWCRDLGILIVKAEQAGDIRVADGARQCLANLQK